MSAERSWGADTVAFGRPREAGTPDPPPRWRPPRGSQRRLPRPAKRTVALAAVGIVALAALIPVLGAGSGSPTAPIREVADPAPRVVAKSPTLPRRRKQRRDRKPDLKRQPQGQLEGGEREHEQATPVPEPAPVAEAEPEPIAEPSPAPPATPTAPVPTSPSAEFGL
jgi:hypothetical protein